MQKNVANTCACCECFNESVCVYVYVCVCVYASVSAYDVVGSDGATGRLSCEPLTR
jgi:hypothetical protein